MSTDLWKSKLKLRKIILKTNYPCEDVSHVQLNVLTCLSLSLVPIAACRMTNKLRINEIRILYINEVSVTYMIEASRDHLREEI